jgi:hypothetical protein
MMSKVIMRFVGDSHLDIQDRNHPRQSSVAADIYRRRGDPQVYSAFLETEPFL